MFNITEYNRHKWQMDSMYALFLMGYHGKYCRLSPLGDDMLSGPLCGAVFHVGTRQPSLFCVL